MSFRILFLWITFISIFSIGKLQSQEKFSRYRLDLFLSGGVSFYGSKDSLFNSCLLYTSDAADERSSVDLGGRRIIKKQKFIEK